MIEKNSLDISGRATDTGQTHQSSHATCGLFFNGTEVVLHRTSGMYLEIDDCKAIRDFLNTTIKEMEKKEVE